MTTITHCSSVSEAMLTKSLLEGSGIRAWVPDEMTAQLAPQLLFAGSGVRVQVEDEDAEKARSVLTPPLVSATPDTADRLERTP